MSRSTRCPICSTDAGAQMLCTGCRQSWERFIVANRWSLDSMLDAVAWAARRTLRLQRPRIEKAIRKQIQRDLEMKRVDAEARGLLEPVPGEGPGQTEGYTEIIRGKR